MIFELGRELACLGGEIRHFFKKLVCRNYWYYHGGRCRLRPRLCDFDRCCYACCPKMKKKAEEED